MSTDVMGRLSLALADRYRIERELGAGGMATVYIAHDLKHERDVAIKVLHPDLGAALGAERFLSEIKTTARLQHPHILPLLDSGAAEGFLYYVMPVVTGETLRGRLNRERQLPIAEAVRIAKEVASALDYAHRQGVVHRDIKPENILLHDGQALVADFGIALAVQSAGGARMTQTGLSLGTPQYMSPEQALGERTIDARSDVYALGAVTYEMITGDPPFSGANVQAIVARLLNEKPTPLHTLRDTVPVAVEQAVLTALAKLPADRFESAKAFGDALLTTGATVVQPSAAPPMSPLVALASRHGGKILFALAMMVAMIEGVALFAAKQRDASEAGAAPVAFTIETPTRVMSYGLQITPDGQRVLYGLSDSGAITMNVMSRRIGQLVSEPVRGANAVLGIFGVTSDSRALLLVRDGKTIQLPLDGAPSSELGPLAWVALLPNGGMVQSRSTSEGLGYRPAPGDSLRALTVPDSARQETAHWGPVVLPSGKAVLFTAMSTPALTGVEVVEIASGKRTRLAGDGAIFPVYSTTGHLLFWRRGTVFAVPFDAKALRVTGPEVAVLDDVAGDPSGALADFRLSTNGTLVYLRQSEHDELVRVNWTDRAGQERASSIREGKIAELALSPDAGRVALSILAARPDLWVHDFTRGRTVRLTETPAGAFFPTWSPDGQYIYFTRESPSWDIWRIRADGSAPAEPVVTSPFDKAPQAVGPDGRLWYFESSNASNSNLKVMDVSSSGPPKVVMPIPARDASMRLSGDGRWIVFHTGATIGARPEVYIARVDGSQRQQVTTTGGSNARFVRGDRELTYSVGDSVMSVAFDPARGEVGSERLLHRFADARELRGRSVAADGERALVLRNVPRPDARPLTVIVNWHTELLRRMKQP